MFCASLILVLWLLHIEIPQEFERPQKTDRPLATTVNGTYAGRFSPEYNQFHFLGMPYAQPPIGSLRFRRPVPLQETWDDFRNATSYGSICPTLNEDTIDVPPGREDCLTINVITPASARIGAVGGKKDEKDLLPVVVYTHGGVGEGGGSAQGQYNFSFVVAHAEAHDMPFIAVSFNYRHRLLGFIASREVQATGNANLGLYDQRQALQWVQANIDSFGGDPRRVTLWGGSSGSEDVGLQLIAFGGRDDSLFRAAIMMGGTSVARPEFRLVPAQQSYDRFVAKTSCAEAVDTLECLRGLSLEELYTVFNHTDESKQGLGLDMMSQSLPAIDGQFIETYGSRSIKDNKFVKVPIMIGVASNEGYNWIGSSWNSWDDLVGHLIGKYPGSYRKYPDSVVQKLLSFYPERLDLKLDLRPAIKNITDFATYIRMEAVLGDLEHNAAKRLMCDAFSSSGMDCYSYRFDDTGALNGRNPLLGARHAADLGSVFLNFEGAGLEPGENPFQGRNQSFYDLSRTMALMFAGFITQLDPNAAFANGRDPKPWLKYTVEEPRNIVFNETGPYWMEVDDVRREATDYINSIQDTVLNK
ncbi:cholinesterase [Thozetella sp. PMI_491]|nr:cholinesterase [Thozetella sp. PMI_491]